MRLKPNDTTRNLGQVFDSPGHESQEECQAFDSNQWEVSLILKTRKKKPMVRTIQYGTDKQSLLIEKLDRQDRRSALWAEPSLIQDAIVALGLKSQHDPFGNTWTYSVSDTSKLLDYLLN